MPDTTVAEVLTYAAALLGDPDQDVYTDAVLTPRFGTAYRDMYRLMDNWGLPKINRVGYFNLSAHNNVLTPTQAGISDLGAPIAIWERGSLTTASISAATDASPIVLTVDDSTGFSTNDGATVDGVSGPTGRINGKWYISVSGSSVTLNGSVAAGTYSSGGTLTRSDEDFVEMARVRRVPEEDPQQDLNFWEWRDDVFFFRPSTEQRQLRIEYESSGTAPSSGSIGIDDSKDFLAHRTAGLTAPSYGEPQQGQILTQLALGPSMQADGSGGFLRDLFLNDLQEKQNRQRRPQPFRRRRNHYRQ